MASSPGLPFACIADLAVHAHLIVPFFDQGGVDGACLHIKRELPFFRLLIDHFLNKDSQVSSLSNSESTVTVAGTFPKYRHSDDSIDMLFNIDETTPEVYPPISRLSHCDF